MLQTIRAFPWGWVILREDQGPIAGRQIRDQVWESARPGSEAKPGHFLYLSVRVEKSHPEGELGGLN